MDPSQAKVVHRRPALIQELKWRPQPLGPSTQAEAVSEVVFSFYSGELYRLVVNYDRYKTEGLTAEDLIAAISESYGSAARGAEEIVLPSIYGDNETLEILARWKTRSIRSNLVRFSHQPSFTLVAISKRLDFSREPRSSRRSGWTRRRPRREKSHFKTGKQRRIACNRRRPAREQTRLSP